MKPFPAINLETLQFVQQGSITYNILIYKGILKI
jgi:hypothetical protein